MRQVSVLTNGVRIYEEDNKCIYIGELKCRSIYIIHDYDTNVWHIKAPDKLNAIASLCCVRVCHCDWELREDIRSGKLKLELM